MSTPEHSPSASDVPPPMILLQMMTGYWIAQAIHVAAKLGLADLLQTAKEQRRTGTGCRGKPSSALSTAACASQVSACSAKAKRAALSSLPWPDTCKWSTRLIA